MNSNEETQSIKLIVEGDQGVGKTSILRSYTLDKLSNEIVRFQYDSTEYVQTKVDGKMVNLFLSDTAGLKTYNRLRTLSYTYADVLLIVFSVVEQTSYDSVYQKWVPLLSHDLLVDIPKIIVGNKIDLRDDENSQHIKFETLFSKHKIDNYFECSALTQKGINEIFEIAIKTAIQNKQILQQKSTNNKDQPLLQVQEKHCCSLF